MWVSRVRSACPLIGEVGYSVMRSAFLIPDYTPPSMSGDFFQISLARDKNKAPTNSMRPIPSRDCPCTQNHRKAAFLIGKERRRNGGRGGIRTPDTLSGTPVFKTGAINHSATLPSLSLERSGTLRKAGVYAEDPRIFHFDEEWLEMTKVLRTAGFVVAIGWDVLEVAVGALFERAADDVA